MFARNGVLESYERQLRKDGRRLGNWPSTLWTVAIQRSGSKFSTLSLTPGRLAAI